jgi:hypothetical protein
MAGNLTPSRGLDGDGETKEGKGRLTARFKMGMASSVETSRSGQQLLSRGLASRCAST